MGTFAFGIGVESSVAVLVDEVPLAFQARAFTDLPDVERIEVLRGPQSTLYGKSASAGLINVITRNPSSTFSFRANALATTDSEYGGNFSVSGPMGQDLGYVLSASYSNWGGNVRNLFSNTEVNGREAFNTRGKIRWEPQSNISFTLSANYLNGNTSVGRPFIRIGPGALLRGTAGLTPAVVFPGVTISPQNQDVSNNYPARTRYWGYGGSLRGEIGLGDLTLVSITSYDKFRLYDYLDHDDTASTAAVGSNIQVGQFHSRLFTQEVRLLSPSDKPFRYTLGAYYAKVNFERPFLRGPAFSLANWYATSQSRQIAGFAQIDWEFVPKLTATAGGRVQNERIGYTFKDNLAVAPNPSFFSGNAEDTAGTYRLGLRYEPTTDLMLFASYSTGYKGQTYDLTTGFNNNRALAGPIKPERSRDKEIGARMQFLEHRLTFNLTYFDTDYTNLQAQTIETLADGSTNFRLTNVGGLNTKGVELDSSARVGSDLNLSASATYLDAKYTSFPVGAMLPASDRGAGLRRIADAPEPDRRARGPGAGMEAVGRRRLFAVARRQPARRGAGQLAVSEQRLLCRGGSPDLPAGLWHRQRRPRRARRRSSLGSGRVRQQRVRQAILSGAGELRGQFRATTSRRRRCCRATSAAMAACASG